MNEFAIDVTEADFAQRVIEASKTLPVVLDFWAEWCGPCRILKPMLEKLAAEYQGRFLLAKIDSDANAGLSARYGIRGIPTVIGLVNGEEVERFSGALPEKQVRDFLARLIPSPAEELRQQALEAFRAGAKGEALAQLEQALALEPENDAVRLAAAEILLHDGKLAEARRWLDGIAPARRTEDRAAALLARLEFAEKGQAAPAASELERRVAADGNDLEARLALANLYVSQQRYEEALAHLLEIVRRDRGFRDDIGRKTMLQVFSLLGGGELVNEYRRRLATALN